MGRRGSLGLQKRPLKWKKKLFRKVLHYLASDSYMYAPLLSCPADPSPDKLPSSTDHSNQYDSISHLPVVGLGVCCPTLPEQSIHIATPDHLSEPPGTPQGTMRVLPNAILKAPFTCTTRDQMDLLYATSPDSPSNVHPMVTRSKSGTLKFKAIYTTEEDSPSSSG